jgi:RNA polymerase sigma factor (sigma-70 family)
MLSTRDNKSLTDTELVSQYRDNGDLALLGELYSRYTSLVYGVCMKYLKDREESRDAVMQLFEKLIVTLRDHDVTHFKSWLYVTARNYCLMHLRSTKGRHLQEISPDIMESDRFAHPDDEPEMESNLSKLEKCIDQLGSEQKACVHLFYIKQKCYKEIVDVTGYDENKVKSYIQNGKRNLKICMEKNDE